MAATDNINTAQKAPQSPHVTSQVLHASAAEAAATGAVGPILANLGLSSISGLQALLNVTAVSGTNPTLDLSIQRLLADGVTWDTFMRFHQKTAAGSEILENAAARGGISARAPDSNTDPTAGTLAAGSVRDVRIGPNLRACWTIGGTGSPTVTFDLTVDGFRI